MKLLDRTLFHDEGEYSAWSIVRLKWQWRIMLIIGLITGYFVGSLWVGKEQDEMIRQVVQALQIATRG